jgi:tetratricopeptide (TPR) repeat protein
MENHREALDSLDQVLDMHNKHIKALYIKGKVLLLMGETQQAINVLNRSLELDPNNVEVKKELAKAQAKHKVQYQNEKNLYKKMMTGVTNEAAKVGEKTKLKTNLKSKSDTSYTTYIAAGIGLALVSIGIALFSKYKN